MSTNKNLKNTTSNLLVRGIGGASTTYGSYVAESPDTVTAGSSDQKLTMKDLPSWLARNLLSAGTPPSSDPSGTDPITENPTYSGAWSDHESIDSYEDFLRNRETAYGSMRDEQTAFYDEQSRKALASIEEQRQAAVAYAENQRESAYESAKVQKENAYTNADVERERSVVDARSSYEQNKASYGANAESMGSMGLSGGGYSDYLDSKAYAQQRAETQEANAQAATVKREADYIEGQAKLTADSTYSKNLFDAETQARTDRLAAEQSADTGKFNAEMSYQKNLLGNDDDIGKHRLEETQEAEEKAAAEAEKAEQDAKYANDSYYQFLAETNQGKYTAEQVAQLAADYGLSEAQKQSLIDAANSYTKKAKEQETQEAEEKAAAEDEENSNYARAAYTELLSGANTGAYTVEQLEQLAADYGLSEAQKQSLIDAANSYTKKTQASTNMEISQNTGDIAGSIQSAVDNGSISKEQGQEHVYNSYKEEIAYGSADTGAIDAAYSKGQISEAQYNDLKARWNNNIETSSDFFFSNGTMLNKSSAKQALDNLSKQSWLSTENKNALTAVYNSLYSPITKSVSFNNDGGWWIFGSTDTGKKGNNFSVKTSDGTKYRVEYGGEATDTNIKEVSYSVDDGQVFGYQGKLYIKMGGNVYIVRSRSNSYHDHYDALSRIFFGDGDTTSVQYANDAGTKAMANQVATTTTKTSSMGSGSVTQTNYSYDHGGKNTKFEITDENGNKKTVWSVHGH